MQDQLRCFQAGKSAENRVETPTRQPGKDSAYWVVWGVHNHLQRRHFTEFQDICHVEIVVAVGASDSCVVRNSNAVHHNVSPVIQTFERQQGVTRRSIGNKRRSTEHRRCVDAPDAREHGKKGTNL
jgi:hypothetical protein